MRASQADAESTEIGHVLYGDGQPQARGKTYVNIYQFIQN